MSGKKSDVCRPEKIVESSPSTETVLKENNCLDASSSTDDTCTHTPDGCIDSIEKTILLRKSQDTQLPQYWAETLGYERPGHTGAEESDESAPRRRESPHASSISLTASTVSTASTASRVSRVSTVSTSSRVSSSWKKDILIARDSNPIQSATEISSLKKLKKQPLTAAQKNQERKVSILLGLMKNLRDCVLMETLTFQHTKMQQEHQLMQLKESVQLETEVRCPHLN